MSIVRTALNAIFVLMLACLVVEQACANDQRDSAAKALCSEKFQLKYNLYVEEGAANLIVPLAKTIKVDNVRVYAVKGVCAQFVDYYAGDTYYLSTKLTIQAKPGLIADIDPRPAGVHENISLPVKDAALSKGVLVDSILISPSRDDSGDKYLGAWVTNGKTRLMVYSKTRTGSLKKEEVIAEVDGQVVSLAQFVPVHRFSDQSTIHVLFKRKASLLSVAFDVHLP